MSDSRIKFRISIPCCLIFSMLGFSLAINGQETRFSGGIDCGLIRLSRIQEASGLAASRKNTGILWVHNDSDLRYNIYAVDKNGKHLGRVRAGAGKPRDCEDIAVGPGPKEGESFIYLGDIGDNSNQYDVKKIYRFPEPDVANYPKPFDITIKRIAVIKYRYPDGRRDAETLMIDPATRDIIIVTKREDSVHVYLAPYPQPLDSVITLSYIGLLPIAMVTGGDISPSGDEVLIKNYFSVYYWKRRKHESWQTTFLRVPSVLPYIIEPQGEAIGWSGDGDGYFTTSEEKGGVPARLYFYRRLK